MIHDTQGDLIVLDSDYVLREQIKQAILNEMKEK